MAAKKKKEMKEETAEEPVVKETKKPKAKGPTSKAIALANECLLAVTGVSPTEQQITSWALKVDEHGWNYPSLETQIKATRRVL